MSSGLSAGMETSAPLISGIITDNAVFHSSSHIEQILPQKSFTSYTLYLVHSMLSCALHFVVINSEVRSVWQPQIWRAECRSIMFKICNHLPWSVHWSTVLLKDEKLALELTCGGQQLL